MNKQTKTAQELADMIASEINVGGAFVAVNPDPVLGWYPTVVVAPRNAHALQQFADRIASGLRGLYDLRT